MASILTTLDCQACAKEAGQGKAEEESNEAEVGAASSGSDSQ
jgi:hypothetical protein